MCGCFLFVAVCLFVCLIVSSLGRLGFWVFDGLLVRLIVFVGLLVCMCFFCVCCVVCLCMCFFGCCYVCA